MSSACRDDRGVVEMFFSCALYDVPIILYCLLGFGSSLDRASTLLGMIEEYDNFGPVQVPGELYLLWSIVETWSERQEKTSHNLCF